MANVFDYLEWRDLRLKNVEFNEIDGLNCELEEIYV